MFYELAMLTVKIGATPKAVAGIKTYLAGADVEGTLLGCFACDIGELNKIAVLRGFEDFDALGRDRIRALHSADPFGCGEVLTHIEVDGYAPFPGIPPIKTGKFGPIYEIRSYVLKPSGLEPTIKAWEAALPARIALSPNIVVMYTLDGAPRFTHIWPYATLEERTGIRSKSVATGVWPPKGGAEHLAVMRNGIWLPTEISPLT